MVALVPLKLQSIVAGGGVSGNGTPASTAGVPIAAAAAEQAAKVEDLGSDSEEQAVGSETDEVGCTQACVHKSTSMEPGCWAIACFHNRASKVLFLSQASAGHKKGLHFAEARVHNVCTSN